MTTPTTPTTPTPANTQADRNRFLHRLSRLTPQTTTPTQILSLRRQARHLNLTCALPHWVTNPKPPPNTPPTPLLTRNISFQALAVLNAKARHTGYPLNALALAYLRATPAPNTNTPLPPGHTPEDAAQARVNALISLANLDPAASTQDQDLLPLMCCSRSSQTAIASAQQR